ncbi:MAG TPA: alpha/beta fold hydrolase [Allosphingosinicella sp.]|nr:alpha/beta fold hydrolase [Allosphingosinicella sp.]
MLISRRSMIGGTLAFAMLAERTGAAIETGVPDYDRELRVPVRGGNIYVRVNGRLDRRRAPLLFVHGGPGAALCQFFPALPLAANRGLIFYDQLDSGRSDAPGDRANWTVDRFVDEIDAIRAALDVGRLHVLGHSWGGIVANRYAARRPRGLRSLILQGAPLSARRFAEGLRTLAAQLPADDAAIMAAHYRGGGAAVDNAAYRRALTALRRRYVATPGVRTGMRELCLPYMAPTPQDRGDAVAMALVGDDLFGGGFGGALRGFDDEHLLSRIRVPTLLLRGELDIVTEEGTRALLPLLRNGSYAQVAGAGHMAQFDQPAAWRDLVAAFVTRHD